MVNLSGALAVLSVLLRPSLVVPHVQVDDINQLDWQSLYDNGVRFLVFDKDNCLTKPHSDQLEDAIFEAWQRCQQVFGRENILMVSNSSGSSSDTSGLGAESLSRALGVPVLCHAQKKPSAKCAAEALNYFVALSSGADIRHDMLRDASIMPPGFAEKSANSHKSTRNALKDMKKVFKSQVPQDTQSHGSILLVGDRTMTDVVLAHRMNDNLMRRRRKLGLLNTASPSLPAPQCISVLTTQIWAKEGAINTWLRKLEVRTTTHLIRKGYQPGEAAWTKRDTSAKGRIDWQKLSTFRHPPNATFTPSQLTLNADQNGTSAFPLTGDTIPTPPPPHSSVGTPTMGALLVSTLTRPLPSVLGRLLAGMLRSRPVTWTVHNFQMGWTVMMAGIASGMHQAGLSPYNRSGRLAKGSRSYPMLEDVEKLTETSLRSRPTRSVPLSIAQMLDSRIPHFDPATGAQVSAVVGNVRQRLGQSASSAKRFYANRLANTTTPTVPAQTLPSASTLQNNSQIAAQRRALHSACRRSASEHGQQNRHQSRNPHMGEQPRRPSARNWIAAISALILVPTCYYGGMRLNQYRFQRKVDQLIDFSNMPDTPAEPTKEQSSTVAARTAAPLSSELAARKMNLQRSLYFLVNDRKDVSDKLENLRLRMQTKKSEPV